MKIQVTYTDNESLTPEEVVENCKLMFGQDAHVSIRPNNSTPTGYLYLGLQLLLTERQVHLFYDEGKYVYDEKIVDLKKEVLNSVEEILNQVIIDNESRIA